MGIALRKGDDIARRQMDGVYPVAQHRGPAGAAGDYTIFDDMLGVGHDGGCDGPAGGWRFRDPGITGLDVEEYRALEPYLARNTSESVSLLMGADPDFRSRHPAVLPFLLDANLLIKPPLVIARKAAIFRAVLPASKGQVIVKQRHVQTGDSPYRRTRPPTARSRPVNRLPGRPATSP